MIISSTDTTHSRANFPKFLQFPILFRFSQARIHLNAHSRRSTHYCMEDSCPACWVVQNLTRHAKTALDPQPQPEGCKGFSPDSSPTLMISSAGIIFVCFCYSQTPRAPGKTRHSSAVLSFAWHRTPSRVSTRAKLTAHQCINVSTSYRYFSAERTKIAFMIHARPDSQAHPIAIAQTFRQTRPRLAPKPSGPLTFPRRSISLLSLGRGSTERSPKILLFEPQTGPGPD